MEPEKIRMESEVWRRYLSKVSRNQKKWEYICGSIVKKIKFFFSNPLAWSIAVDSSSLLTIDPLEMV